MGSYTDNLGLYKVNTETDGNDTFNIDTMMNDNWDIIDAFSKGLRMKTYTNLSQIGLTAGSETIESILTAMPVNSILYVEVGASNADIYPTHYGTFIARKLSTSRWFAEFYPKETTDLYVCSAKIENSTFAFYDWKKKADYDDIEEVKKSVSDGKTLVANAITAKGVSTAANATFQTMADNVAKIPELGGYYKQCAYSKVEGFQTSKTDFGVTSYYNYLSEGTYTITSDTTIDLVVILVDMYKNHRGDGDFVVFILNGINAVSHIYTNGTNSVAGMESNSIKIDGKTNIYSIIPSGISGRYFYVERISDTEFAVNLTSSYGGASAGKGVLPVMEIIGYSFKFH